VQITALGNPKLLERVAAGLMAIRNLFSQFDLDMNNVITREEFIKVSQQPHMWCCLHDSIGCHSHSSIAICCHCHQPHSFQSSVAHLGSQGMYAAVMML